MKTILMLFIVVLMYGCATAANTKIAATAGAIGAILPPVRVTVGFEFGNKKEEVRNVVEANTAPGN